MSASKEVKNINSIQTVIENIPEILVYFVPGYVGLYMFCTVTHRMVGEASLAILSCSVSYIIISIFRIFFDSSVYIEFVVCLCASLLFSYSAIRLFQNKRFRDFVVDMMSFSPAHNAWDDVFDYDVGCVVTCKFKKDGRVATGVIRSISDPVKDPWMALSSYSLCSDESGEIVLLKADCDNDYLMINLNDVEYVTVLPNISE